MRCIVSGLCLVASGITGQAGLLSQGGGSAGQPVNAGHAWVIIVDDLHLDFTSTGRIRDLLRTIVRQLPQDADVVGMVSTGPSSVAMDLTNARSGLEPAINKVAGAGLRPAEIFDSLLMEKSEVRYRAHVTFSTAYDVVTKLGRVANSGKALIYISNGYHLELRPGGARGDADPFRPDDSGFTDERLRAEVAALTQAAKRANVTIFAVNADGLFPRPSPDPQLPQAGALDRYRAVARHSLDVISEETGGFAVQDDLERGLQRIARHVGAASLAGAPRKGGWR